MTSSLSPLELQQFQLMIQLNKNLMKSKASTQEEEALDKPLSKAELKKELLESYFQQDKDKLFGLVKKGAPWLSTKADGMSIFQAILINKPEWMKELISSFSFEEMQKHFPGVKKAALGLLRLAPLDVMEHCIEMHPEWLRALVRDLPDDHKGRYMGHDLVYSRWFIEGVLKSTDPERLRLCGKLSTIWQEVFQHPQPLVCLEMFKMAEKDFQELSQKNPFWQWFSVRSLEEYLECGIYSVREVMELKLTDESAQKRCLSVVKNVVNNVFASGLQHVWGRVVQDVSGCEQLFQDPSSFPSRLLGLNEKILSVSPLEQLMAWHIVHENPTQEFKENKLGDLTLSEPMVQYIKWCQWGWKTRSHTHLNWEDWLSWASVVGPKGFVFENSDYRTGNLVSTDAAVMAMDPQKLPEGSKKVNVEDLTGVFVNRSPHQKCDHYSVTMNGLTLAVYPMLSVFKTRMSVVNDYKKNTHYVPPFLRVGQRQGVRMLKNPFFQDMCKQAGIDSSEWMSVMNKKALMTYEKDFLQKNLSAVKTKAVSKRRL